MSYKTFTVQEDVLALLANNRDSFTAALKAGLTSDIFSDASSKNAFEIMRDLHENNIPLVIENLIRRFPEDERDRWAKALTDGPITQNIGYYVNALKSDRVKKIAFEAFRELTLQIGKHDPFMPIENLFGQIVTTMNNVLSHASRRADAASVGSIYDELCDAYDKDIGTGMRNEGHVLTGFKTLDTQTSGFSPGSLYTVAARTGLGKTTLACNFAINAAEKGKRVAIFSIEMTAHELTEKMISNIAGISVLRFENRLLSDIELDRVSAAREKFHQMPINIYDVDSDFAKLQASIQAIGATGSTDLVIIDYVQLLKVRGAQSRNYEIQEITNALKSTAKRLSVPVVILAQLNRSVETDDGFRRPGLRDLKDSSSIEQDSNGVFFIHEEKGEYELIIGKNRKGQKGSIKLKVDLKNNRMSEAEREGHPTGYTRLPYSQGYSSLEE